LLLVAVVTARPGDARADGEIDIAGLICGEVVRPLARATAVGQPTFVIGMDGTLAPEAVTASPGMQLAFTEFPAPILVRVEVPTRKLPRTVACGWINPLDGHFALPVEPPAGSILRIDVYMMDEKRGDVDAAAVFRAEPRPDRIAALSALEALELEARCRSTRSAVYLVHQEIGYAVGELFPVRFDDAGEFELVRTGRPLWLAVTDVPSKAALRIAQNRGDKVGFTVESAVRTAVPRITRLAPGAPSARGGAANDVASCQPDATPLAERGTRVVELRPIDRRHVSNVSVCDDAECPGDGDANVRGRVKLAPSPRGRWAVMTELSFGVGVAGWHLADRGQAVGFEAQTDPVFEPILGARGPEQVFELHQRANPRNAVTTSLLLARHVTDRWFVGAGPSLTIGTGGAALGQLGVRAGRELGDTGVYVTLGASARFVDAPELYAIGDRVTLAQTEGMTSSAPAFASHTAVLVQAEIGLSIDLALIVAGVSDVFSAVGGTR
jgi:hypothetical protein